MKKIIETEVMTFDALESDKAKDAARQWWLEGGLDNWYESVEEDAKTVKLKLGDFSMDSASFISAPDLEFIDGANSTAQLVLENHGEDCDTYKAAIAFEKAKDALPELPLEKDADYYRAEREKCETFDTLEADFLNALTKCYKKLLQKELDYQCSNESVDAALLANEYTFTADGKRFG